MQVTLRGTSLVLAFDDHDEVASFGGKPLALSRHAFAVLRGLASAQGALVTRNELMRAGWPEVRVGDGSLRQLISELRREFGKLGDTVLESVRGKGYRLRVDRLLDAVPPSGVGEPSALALVGRELECASLRERVRSAAAGSGSCVLLTGAVGVGKTRLLRALLEYAVGTQTTVLDARASQHEGAPPLWPFLNAFAEHPAARAAVESEPSVLALVRGVRDASGDTPWPITPGERRFLTVEALVRVFLAMTEERALLVIVDDAHLVDVTTRALFARLHDELPNRRLCLVLAARAGADVLGPLAHHRLTLQPFSPDTLERVLAVELDAPLSAAEANEIHALSSGNAREATK